MKLSLQLFILFMFLGSIANAQVYSIMQDLEEEEKKSIEAIALYPEEERNAILEASTHPEILIRMQNIRRKTEDQFQEVIALLSREDQQKMYSLSRYPELLSEMCESGKKKSKKEIQELTENYPEEVQKDAGYLNRKYFDRLEDINALYQNSQSAFEDLLEPYSEKLHLAYLRLLKLPEVVSILTENMGLTVLLGDAYSKNPVLLKQELDSLNVIVAEQKAKELKEWKQYLEENPEAMEEFEQASQEFAKEQGYSETIYDDNYYARRYTSEIFVYPYWQPYPYWFGWPWWYAYECWYPYPWWYHWGYYYGPGNVIVFVGLPSSYFMYWHFAYYSHCYYYPHFTNVIVNYYYSNPDLNNSITSSVSRWEAETKKDLPVNWLENSDDRVERIREYGKFKMNYNETIRNLNTSAPSQREYMKLNKQQYPVVGPMIKENERPYYVPDNEPEKIKSPKEIQPRQKVIDQKQYDYQKIDRARIYHHNVWALPKPVQRSNESPTRDNSKYKDDRKEPKSKSHKN